jgi:serine/threonine protein kinase
MSTRTYGTIAYMPPELIRDGKLSSKADVYAFGILMWALFCGAPPYEGLPTATVFYRVAIEGARPEVPDGMPAEYAGLMTACWASDPAARPTFRQVYARLTPLAASAREAARSARAGGGGGGGMGSWAGGARQGSGANAGVGSVGGSPQPQPFAAPQPPPPPPATDPPGSPDRDLPPPVRPGPFATFARQMSPFRRSLSRQRSSGGGE